MNAGDTLTARLTPVTLVAGKGGVGKTTIAAATAIRFAERGARTLVVTTDPAATLLAALARPVERTVEPIHLAAHLDAWAPDTRGVRDAFLARWREPIATILDRGTYLDKEDIDGLVDATLPGADEIFAVLALGEILSRSGDDAYERVVIDTAPTGHTLRLLNLPQSFAALVRLLDTMQEKHRFMVRALTHRYRTDAADALIAELQERVETLQQALTDPKRTSAVLVVRPEPVVIAESTRYLDALQLAGIAVSAVVINTWSGTEAELAAIAPLHRPGATPPLFTAPPIEGDAIPTLLGKIKALPATRTTKKKDFLRRDDQRLAGSSSVPSAAAVLSLARSLTIVAGKGGVGKTTTACAIAIAIADLGNTTLLVSTDPAPSVGDALGLSIGDEETAVPGVPSLKARQMDATRAFTTFRDLYQGRIDDLFERLGGRGIDIAHDRGIIRDLLTLAPPGIDELYALTALGETSEQREFSYVIVDPAPTGHLLRLLDMPAMAVAWAHQLMRMMLKYKEVVGLGEAAQDLLTFAKRTRALGERMRDPSQSAAVLVTLDEPLVRGESERLLAELGDRSLSVSGIVWNRATESTPPLPRAASVPQYFAPLATPAPIGVEAIRQWSRHWSHR